MHQHKLGVVLLLLLRLLHLRMHLQLRNHQNHHRHNIQQHKLHPNVAHKKGNRLLHKNKKVLLDHLIQKMHDMLSHLVIRKQQQVDNYHTIHQPDIYKVQRHKNLILLINLHLILNILLHHLNLKNLIQSHTIRLFKIFGCCIFICRSTSDFVTIKRFRINIC